ncbi:MAG: nucleoside 2-deoxyribosyltransferase domain-containing protein [bacterium]
MFAKGGSMEIKAPNNYEDQPRPWIFLAGSIEMGEAKNWQEKFVKDLPEFTILNPRRDDWDSSWEQSIDNEQFREQVEWELEAQENADAVVFHFEPDTKSPITLLELGLFRHKAIVHCPEGFWRKGNVDIVCDKYGILRASSLKRIADIISYMKKKGE